MDLASAFRSSYLWSGLTGSQIDRLSLLAEEKTFNGGDTMVRQFAKDSDVMIILDGKARINTFSGEMIGEAGPGAVIGEISLVDDKPRSATVVAVGNCRAAVIRSSELWTVMEEEPVIAKVVLLNIAKILCGRLRAANVQLDMAVKS